MKTEEQNIKARARARCIRAGMTKEAAERIAQADWDHVLEQRERVRQTGTSL